MELTILERLLCLSILPLKGSVVSMKIVDELGKELSFTEDEMKKYSIKATDDGAGYTWDNSFDGAVKVVEMAEYKTDIIKKALKGLDDKEEVTRELLPLFRKFGVM
jgi:hypothetical protein